MPATANKRAFRIEYEHNESVYVTVVESDTRTHAIEKFKRDNPHVHYLRCANA
jgi:hypothetical protein